MTGIPFQSDMVNFSKPAILAVGTFFWHFFDDRKFLLCFYLDGDCRGYCTLLELSTPFSNTSSNLCDLMRGKEN